LLLDDSYNDIVTATGIEWHFLLPLLLKVGLLSFRVSSVVRETLVMHNQWEELAKAISKHVRLQITKVRLQESKNIQYFFVLGNPLYKNPILQQKECKFTEISIPNKSHTERKFSMAIRHMAEKIINLRLVSRVTHQGIQQEDQGEEMGEEEVREIAVNVDSQINYALALDLKRRPRLSRTNAGKKKR
jgi:hypothetical protein